MTEPSPTVPPPRPEPATASTPSPSEVPADGEVRRLDPRILAVWRLGTLTTLIVPLTLAVLVGTAALDVPAWVPAAGVTLLLGLAIGPLPRLRWHRWSWALTGPGIELASGVLVRRRVTLPYFRIQQIDVVEGPLERLLGLATLTVTTASAGGSVSLPGLAAEDAPALRRALVARAAQANAQLASEGHDAV
jgi:membrane protein YdbS with pleckstrin-like domain